MFERFTDRARKVMALANQEAQRFNHEYIGTEHILLGLLKEGEETTRELFTRANVSMDLLQAELERRNPPREKLSTSVEIPFSEETKKALQDAFSNFSKLIFAHGIVKYKTDCQVCYAINDWIYLRNIAQANGGYLVGKVEAITDSKAADGPVVGVGRALVESITMTMLSSIQSSIKTYRSITANLNQQLDNLPLSPTKDIADKIRVLGDARDQEMGLMVAALLSASQKDRLADETNKSNKNSLMSTLYRSYSCSGFDGSSVDQ